MVEDKYTIYYRIYDIEYNFRTTADEPKIVLTLIDFKFGKENKSRIAGEGGLLLYLNKSTFSELTGHSWDGTPEDVKRLRKDLEGKVYKLDLGMRTKK